MLARTITLVGFVIAFGSSALDVIRVQASRQPADRPSSDGQEPKTPDRAEQGSKNLLARLSYDSTYVSEERGQQYSSRLCFEVYRDGHYRISRVTKKGTENLGGTMPQEQVSQLANLVKKIDFDSKGGGIVRLGSETFVAEIARGDKTRRYIWVDPDHHRPFPDPATDVIQWLQDFKAQGATPLTASERSMMQICPRMSDNPVQPVTLRCGQ
jgi:hypothetical protein